MALLREVLNESGLLLENAREPCAEWCPAAALFRVPLCAIYPLRERTPEYIDTMRELLLIREELLKDPLALRRTVADSQSPRRRLAIRTSTVLLSVCLFKVRSKYLVFVDPFRNLI